MFVISVNLSSFGFLSPFISCHCSFLHLLFKLGLRVKNLNCLTNALLEICDKSPN